MAAFNPKQFASGHTIMFFRTDIVSSLILTVVAYAAVRILLLLRKGKTFPLPPGPKPWPVLGNITDLPQTGIREWEFWLKHKDSYGQSHRYILLAQGDTHPVHDM